MPKWLLSLCVVLALPGVSLRAAPLQPEARTQSASPWVRAGDRVAFATASISFPTEAGPVRLREATESSRRGEGVDNILQYESAERDLFATIYVYIPGLSHAGLTAFMTDRVIAAQSRNLVRSGSRIVSAGGRSGAAIRSDYTGYRDDLASSAAFVKVGRWLVKVRVSGPDARREDVDAVMTTLLNDIRFEGELQPRPASILEVGECAPVLRPGARSLPVTADRLMMLALIGMFDVAGDDARDPQGNRVPALPPRIATHWCQSSQLHIGNTNYAVLRAAPDDPAEGIGGRSELIVPINDAGTTLEQVRISDPQQFVMLFHEIGRTSVLGSYDGPLSDDQIAAILNGSDGDGTRIRASIDHMPNGNSNINLPQDAADSASSPST
jgi:hypothetical protein